MAPAPVELDGQKWDLATLKQTRTSSSLPAMHQHMRIVESLGPSAMLGMAAIATTANPTQAMQLLRNDFGMTAARSRTSIAVGSAMTGGAQSTNDALGHVAGVKLTTAQRNRICRALNNPQIPLSTTPIAVDGHKLCTAAARVAWDGGRYRRYALDAARTNDPAVMQAAAAVTAGLRSHDSTRYVDKLTGYQTYPLATGAKSKLAERANDILSAAYSMSAVHPDGLDLGTSSWAGAPANWRASAAPWVYSILDGDNGADVAALLDAVRARGWGFVAPGDNPFPFNDSTAELNDARLRVQTFSNQATKWLDRPWWFDEGKGSTQVLVTQDEDRYMYAWAGVDGVGMLVAFDLVDLIPYGRDAPGARAAVALALGWYLDGSVSLRKSAAGTTTVARASGGTKQTGVRYVPTPSFTTQVKQVKTGSHAPPRMHGVVAHLRTLKSGKKPSAAARQNAPARLRDSMKSNQTFVRSHTKGQGNLVALENRLSNHSALADVIAGLQRRTP